MDWLYGMRDSAVREQAAAVLRSARTGTGARIEAHSQQRDLPAPADQLAALTVVLDIGIAVQHLIDPEEVPGELFGSAMRLMGGESAS